MTILVTGSAGFLGQNLVPFLKKSGHTVIGIDLKPDTHSHLSYQQDLLSGVFDDMPKIDICIHLASRVGGFLHNNLKEELPDYELALLKSVKKICDEKNCERIIYTSSINVFENEGDYNHGPLQIFNQKTPYARAKMMGEKFVQNHFKEFVILRPTNLFGKTQMASSSQAGSSHVIPELLHKIKMSPVVEILGDGNQVRNFIHVSDVCHFIHFILKTPSCDWFNLRSEIQMTIKNLALELVSFLNEKRELIFRPEFLKYEPKPICLFDIEKLTQMGWKPHFSEIKSGLLF